MYILNSVGWVEEDDLKLFLLLFKRTKEFQIFSGKAGADTELIHMTQP